MKKFNEIGITPLKFDNHISTDKLDEAIYELNDILYFLTNRYRNINTKVWLRDSLTRIGQKVKELHVSEKAEPRKQEFLTKMRNLFKLNNADDVSYKPNAKEREEYQKMINYQVAKFIKLKDDAAKQDKVIDEIDCLTYLRENKKVELFYVLPFVRAKTDTNLQLKSFWSVQNELLNYLQTLYRFTDIL